MPLYTYRCHSCFHATAAFRKVEDRYNAPPCDECSSTDMHKILDAPAVRGDYAPYECPITGKWIEGRRAHEENLARHGCRVIESGEREEITRRKAREEETLLADVDRTVEAEIHSWEPRKREKLAAELEGGIDASIVRN